MAQWRLQEAWPRDVQSGCLSVTRSGRRGEMPACASSASSQPSNTAPFIHKQHSQPPPQSTETPTIPQADNMEPPETHKATVTRTYCMCYCLCAHSHSSECLYPRRAHTSTHTHTHTHTLPHFLAISDHAIVCIDPYCIHSFTELNVLYCGPILAHIVSSIV